MTSPIYIGTDTDLYARLIKDSTVTGASVSCIARRILEEHYGLEVEPLAFGSFRPYAEDRIRDCLLKGDRTMSQIMEETGLSRKLIRRVLEGFRTDKKVIQIYSSKGNIWRLKQ